MLKTLEKYKEMDNLLKEEKKRTIIENIRKETLADILWKSYCNNSKLWSVLILNDIERKKYGIPKT